MQDKRFEQKVALVTGAASGLGRATALRLATEGADIFAADLDTDGLSDTAAIVREAGGRIETGSCNVTKRNECAGAVEAAIKTYGKLDVLCNSAGVNRFHHFTDMPEDDWHLIIGVNLTGTAFMCQAAIPALLETGGNIVNVASVAGLQGQAYTVAYTASKGGVIQLTRSLAMEYIDRGIRVNAVAPGGVDTPMNVGIEFPKDLDWELVKRYSGRRGMASAEEIADAIVYLAAPNSRVMHGVILPLDQGMTAG